jgi:hypothetical protein
MNFLFLLCSPEADVEHLWQRTQAWQVNHWRSSWSLLKRKYQRRRGRGHGFISWPLQDWGGWKRKLEKPFWNHAGKCCANQISGFRTSGHLSSVVSFYRNSFSSFPSYSASSTESENWRGCPGGSHLCHVGWEHEGEWPPFLEVCLLVVQYIVLSDAIDNRDIL